MSDYKLENLARIIEEMPVTIPEGMVDPYDIDLYVAGHAKARQLAADFLRDPVAPVILHD